ncbi:MAG: hypothetical protein Q4D37_02585 [Oscillospiraceae bacterium]|nr:hypothetical protein [Oscillospiraceae bacterium]
MKKIIKLAILTAAVIYIAKKVPTYGKQLQIFVENKRKHIQET